MFMFNKIKQLGNGLKENFFKGRKSSEEEEESPCLSKDSKDDVRRRIEFEQICTASDLLHKDNDDKSLNLKRLFKSRAKKLMERAESLTNDPYSHILSSDEEEKDFTRVTGKVIDPKIKDLRRLQSTHSMDNFDIAIDLKNDTLENDKIDQSNTAKIEERKEEQVEELKEDQEGESFKKFKEERNKICGMKRAKSFNKKEEFERSLKDFTCTICMDYMVGTRKLICGHCFCDQCISLWFLREKACPICREKTRDEKNIQCNLVDFTIEHILTRAYQNDSSMLKDLKNWQKRKIKYNKWRESHALKNFKIGDKIDVRDTEYIWCIGFIEKILKSKYDYPDLLYIHYEGWNRCYDEYIPVDSDRISPLSLYTSRTDIPKYARHEGFDDRVYGNVVEGGDIHNHYERNQEINNQNDDNEDEANNNDNPDPILNNDIVVGDNDNNEGSANIDLPTQTFTIDLANPDMVDSASGSRPIRSQFIRNRVLGVRDRISNLRPPSRRGPRERGLRSNGNLNSSFDSLHQLFDSTTNSLLSSTRAIMRDLVSNRPTRRRYTHLVPPGDENGANAEEHNENNRQETAVDTGPAQNDEAEDNNPQPEDEQ